MTLVRRGRSGEARLASTAQNHRGESVAEILQPRSETLSSKAHLPATPVTLTVVFLILDQPTVNSK